MAQKFSNRYLERFKRNSVSDSSDGENVNNIQKKLTFIAPTRIWITYILFNVGLLLPAIIFKVSNIFLFQLNLEITVLFALWAIFVHWKRKRWLGWFAAGFVLFYMIAMVYRIYAGAMLGLYQRDANFYNDYSFVFGGMAFLLDALNLPVWIYLAGGMTIIVLIGLIFWGAWSTFKGTPICDLRRVTRFGLTTLGLIAIIVVGIFPHKTADLQIPVSSLTAELTENIRRSFESRENLKTFVSKDPMDSYDYKQYPLSETPNVFFIFIESYGSVLYQRPHFTSPYLEMMDALEKSLANDGWSAVSTISDAPTWGGGSWMSYTSALFGVLVDQQSEYDALKKKYSELEYPNIGRYFSSQGYDYVWVVPIDRQLPKKREEVDQRFYGANRWITIDTLNYDGPLFGWGPSVPDQFTFGFIQDFVFQQEKPTFLVYLTQNSHYPWTPLPPVLDDWREMENLDMQDGVISDTQKKGLSVGESRQNYLQAINNTFDYLNKFIKSVEKENTVIVLVGDHQPPTVSRREDGYGTMVHVISQDDDFLASFHNYGFVDGLVLDNLEPTIRHEGIYSLFVRCFVAKYGVSPWNLPDYLPDGSQ